MDNTTRRRFLQQSAGGAMAVLAAGTSARSDAAEAKPPNILFAIADDWSWPHASIHGAKGIQTPNFDRVGKEGCLFQNAFTVAPQCSPNRAATLTGRYIWQIEEAGTHGSIFPNKFSVFPDLLEGAGYHVGFTGKGWSPGDWKRGGWKRNPAGNEYSRKKLREVPAKGIKRLDYAGNFDDFLGDRPEGTPFCFWFGASEPHRGYELGSGRRAGKNPDGVTVPPFLPDAPEVREDLLDYFVEVEWFDSQLGAMLDKLEAIGEAENTLVVVTSDNGMPFPRAKATVYEYGTHVPLAIRWPARVKPGRTTPALFSFVDFAPTFLDAAGVTVPGAMSGVSHVDFLTDSASPARNEVQTGRERHTHARFDNLGYPARTVRTADYLYIRNFKPDRWPAGDPEEYHDIDGAPSKSFLLEHKADYPELFELTLGKAPGEQLYAIQNDPGCLNNLTGDSAHATAREELAARLDALLKEQGDPRVLGTGDIFESYPRVSGMRPELGGFAERGEYNPKYQPKP